MESIPISQNKAAEVRHPKTPWKILIIDDEVGLGESLRLILRTMGHEIVYVDNGEEALQLLQEQPFDLVISDLVMLGVNGYDILDFVKQEGLNLPVIMLTGLDSVEAAVRSLKLGAYDFILKPFELDSFKKSIQRALEKRELESIHHIQQHRLDTIASIARAAASTLKLDEIFKILLQQSHGFASFDSAAFLILNEQDLAADFFSASAENDFIPSPNERLALDHPLVLNILRGNLSVTTKEVASVEPWVQSMPLFKDIESYLLIPLISKNHLSGGLFFGCRPGNRFGDQDRDFLVTVADQISVAVENARLLALEVRRSRQLEIINSIGRQLTFSQSVEQLGKKAVQLLQGQFHFLQVEIFTFDPQKQIVTRTASTQSSPQTDEVIVLQAVRTLKTLLVQSHAQPPQAVETRLAQIVVPLKSDSDVLGVLSILDAPNRILTHVEISVIEAIALQISLAWKSAQLFEQTCIDKNYLESILATAEDTAIITFDPQGRVITFNSGAGKILGIPPESARGSLITDLIPSVQAQEMFNTLLTGQGPSHWGGEIDLNWGSQRTAWVNIHIRPIEPSSVSTGGFLIIMIDITARVELDQKLTQLTVTDDLTGLYNQRFFFEQLNREIERADRRNAPLSLCIFDLDKFKQLNDTEGHLAGDEILRTVGNIVSGTIRVKIDSAFRYGGDEFVLLLPETNIPQAVNLLERLRATIDQKLNGRITISGGITEYRAGLLDKELIDAADKLLYVAKRRGGNLILFATAESSRSDQLGFSSLGASPSANL
jgi:diguanylate cyclase (GGDEF)-like protein/PAS domain S-box-containing protein